MDDRGGDFDKGLISVTQSFLQESGVPRAARAVHIEAKLEQELGIGSLEKAELFHRIETEFHTHLPESLLAEAKTLKEVRDQLLVLPHSIKKNRVTIENIPLAKLDLDLEKITTLGDVIRQYAEVDASRPYIYLQENDKEKIITYGYLYQQSLKVAGGLAALGIRTNDAVAIMLPTSEAFFFSIYAVWILGAMPVPIYPPLRMDQIEEYINKEAKILHNAGAKVLITFKEAEVLSKILRPFIPSLSHVTDVKSLLKSKPFDKKSEVNSEDIALLQYTSGSTGNPKGVVLTHDNLLTNIRCYGKAIQIQPTDVVVSWLPLYHDMGLIGAVMGTLYHGVPLILMSPLAFLMRPEKWLWSIHYRRGTLSAAPNFAYELCTKKIKDEDIVGIDLSSWRVALNGAEAVYPKTMERFAERFSPYGFNEKAFFPAYGLAECAVALTFPPVGRGMKIDSVDKQIFEKEQKAVCATGSDTYDFVSCGTPLEKHEIRVVDAKNHLLPERQIGHLQFRGPSAMQGYYRNAKATNEAYYDGWWFTGDLAYIADNELYITGRQKDSIIKAGRNYYPPEIEDAASEVKGIRKGCVVAFGISDKKSGTEKIVVIAERNPKYTVDEATLINDINEKVMARIALAPDDTQIVAPRTIPKTSSGKLRRSDCKKMYAEGRLAKQGKSVFFQLTKMFLRSVGRRIQKAVINLAKLVITFYASVMVLMTLFPVWLISHILPKKAVATLMKGWAWIILFLCFCPLKIKGKENIYQNGPQIFVANHTSYADIILLLTTLPKNTIYVGKKELLKVPVIRFFIRKLGHLCVDRWDISKSESDMERISQEIKKGHSVLFFPEGTFTRIAGVRPFKLGPYKLSTMYDVPIVPVALCNMRHVLRGNQFLLSPRVVTITVLKGGRARGKKWQDAVHLRDWSRQKISEQCGEEPIDLIVAGPTET